MGIDVIDLIRMDSGYFERISDRLAKGLSIRIGLGEMKGIGCQRSLLI